MDLINIYINKNIMANVTKYTKFDINALEFSELIDNKKALKRKAYPNYKGSNFLLQTPILKIDSGGIPRISDWVKTDKDRQYCYVPLDPLDDLEKTRESKEEHGKRVEDTTQLKRVFQQIDEKVGSKEFQKQLFGSEVDKYEHKYYSLIKRKEVIEDSDDDDDEKEKPIYPDKFKVKFHAFDWSTGDYEGPNCELYTKQAGEKGNGNKVDTKGMSIDDFSKYVGYMRNMTFVLQLGFWADKKKGRSDPIHYGLTLTIKVVQVDERQKLAAMDYSISLLSSDEDDEEEEDKDEKEDESVEVEELAEVKPKRRSRAKK